MTMQDGIRAVQKAFGGPTPPRWPMYVRQAKQFLRNAIDGFDEKNYGFASVVDLLRAAGKEGVLRIERDRQGAVRVFPGPKLTQPVRRVQPDCRGRSRSRSVRRVVDAEPSLRNRRSRAADRGRADRSTKRAGQRRRAARRARRSRSARCRTAGEAASGRKPRARKTVAHEGRVAADRSE